MSRQCPEAYKEVRNGLWWNRRTLALWILVAIFHSLGMQAGRASLVPPHRLIQKAYCREPRRTSRTRPAVIFFVVYFMFGYGILGGVNNFYGYWTLTCYNATFAVCLVLSTWSLIVRSVHTATDRQLRPRVCRRGREPTVHGLREGSRGGASNGLAPDCMSAGAGLGPCGRAWAFHLPFTLSASLCWTWAARLTPASPVRPAARRARTPRPPLPSSARARERAAHTRTGGARGDIARAGQHPQPPCLRRLSCTLVWARSLRSHWFLLSRGTSTCSVGDPLVRACCGSRRAAGCVGPVDRRTRRHSIRRYYYPTDVDILNQRFVSQFGKGQVPVAASGRFESMDQFFSRDERL